MLLRLHPFITSELREGRGQRFLTVQTKLFFSHTKILTMGGGGGPKSSGGISQENFPLLNFFFHNFAFFLRRTQNVRLNVIN